MRTGILAAGNWIVDAVKTVDVYPAQDALANIFDESESNGGSPYNLLIDLAKLGANFELGGIGLVGSDEAGDRVFQDCQAHGIDCRRILRTNRAPTSYTLVINVKATGRRTFFHQRGANALLGPEHFDLNSSSAKLFHLGYLLLLDRLDVRCSGSTGAAVVLERAKQLGFVTSIDVVSEDSERFREVVLPALPHCDICFMNELEAERTTGVRLVPRDFTSLGHAAESLFEQGLVRISVIHFEEGVYARDRSGAEFYQGSVKLPAEQIRGLLGSGDAFAAGFLLAFHEDRPIKDCLRLGVCSAAACIRDVTTSGGVLEASECLALGERYGFR